MFQGSLKVISRKFQGCFEGVLRVFQGSFNGVEEVSRAFQISYMEDSRTLSRCFKKVSCCMALIAASRAEGGLVFYLYVNLNTKHF